MFLYSNVWAQDLRPGFNVGDQQFWPVGVSQFLLHTSLPSFCSVLAQPCTPISKLSQRKEKKKHTLKTTVLMWLTSIHITNLSSLFPFVSVLPPPPQPPELNWANSSQRRSSRSLRTAQRSTPTTPPPMGSSTSSRRTLPELSHRNNLHFISQCYLSRQLVCCKDRRLSEAADHSHAVELKHSICCTLIIIFVTVYGAVVSIFVTVHPRIVFSSLREGKAFCIRVPHKCSFWNKRLHTISCFICLMRNT